MSVDSNVPPMVGMELAGSLPLFPRKTGGSLTNSLEIDGFRYKRLVFNRLSYPGQAHVYRAACRAGERLRVQMYVPMLPLGGAVVPAFALVAQSLPYSADMHKLPFSLPAGFSAVVAPPPDKLVAPVTDMLTRARFYPAPVIDTHTLIGGNCYIIVWSPHNHMGKYVLQIGHVWPWRWTYWAQLPLFWWQIRGWFGISRAVAYGLAAGLATIGVFLITLLSLRRKRHRRSHFS